MTKQCLNCILKNNCHFPCYNILQNFKEKRKYILYNIKTNKNICINCGETLSKTSLNCNDILFHKKCSRCNLSYTFNIFLTMGKIYIKTPYEIILLIVFFDKIYLNLGERTSKYKIFKPQDEREISL